MERSLYLMVALLHQVLAFGTILCKIDVTEREKRDLSKDDLAVLNLFNSSRGILVGESTPIWYAYHWAPDRKPGVFYTYSDDETYISMKQVMKRYKDGKYKTVFPLKSRRSVDKSVSNMVKNIENRDIETLSTSSTRDVGGEISVVKRETNDDTHYLSILIVMYDDRTNEDRIRFPDPRYKDYYYDKVIDSLTFWNDVDLQLRHLRNPRVRLRIAGIVFGQNIHILHYLRGKYIDWRHGFLSDDAVKTMVQYWRTWRPKEEEKGDRKFHFDIVVTEAEDNFGVLEAFLYKTWNYEVSRGPLCTDDTVRPAAGLLLQNKKQLGFDSIQQAVKGIATILGAKTDQSCPAKHNDVMAENLMYQKIGRKWSKCTLDQISANLRANGSCLRKLDESFPPGKPIVILPGTLLPPSNYCRIYDYDEPVFSMKNSQCDIMYCANNNTWSTWQPFHIPDGTTCDEGKVCLDEKCVSNTILNVV